MQASCMGSKPARLQSLRKDSAEVVLVIFLSSILLLSVGVVSVIVVGEWSSRGTIVGASSPCATERDNPTSSRTVTESAKEHGSNNSLILACSLYRFNGLDESVEGDKSVIWIQ